MLIDAGRRPDRFEIKSTFFVFLLTTRIHREPSFQDPLSLIEHLLDRPERRKREHTRQGRQKDILDHKRNGTRDQSDDEEPPPAPRAEMIFTLYTYRMEHADYQKSTQAYRQSEQMMPLQDGCKRIHDYKINYNSRDLCTDTTKETCAFLGGHKSRHR